MQPLSCIIFSPFRAKNLKTFGFALWYSSTLQSWLKGRPYNGVTDKLYLTRGTTDQLMVFRITFTGFIRPLNITLDTSHIHK